MQIEQTTDPALATATAATPESQTATPEAVQAAQPEATPAPEAKAPIEGAVMVPNGTVAKMTELAQAGDAAAIEAWIKEQPESLQASLRDAFDGKATIQDDDPITELTAENFEPFSDEELAQLDPALARRAAFLQEQLASQIEAAERAANTLPEPMQRLLQDPFVAARLEEMRTGKSYIPSELNTEEILEFAKNAAAAGDSNALSEMLTELVAAIPELMLGVRGQVDQEFRVREAEAERVREFNSFMHQGLTNVGARIPEFKSSLPEIVQNDAGEYVPNPQHPAGEFTYWLGDMMREGVITQATLRKLGFEKIAYTFLAEKKGGMGQVVAGAVKSAQEILRDKLARSRSKAISGSAAKTLNVPSSGVVRPLLHGVDLELALRDHSYASRLEKSLTPSQLSEVVGRLKEMAGLTNSK